jgi:AraC family transcriptional regulator
MNVFTKELPGFKLIGFKADFVGVMVANSTANSVIPALWQKLNGVWGQYEDVFAGVSLGVLGMPESPNPVEGQLNYFAGMAVVDLPPANDDLEQIEVPAGKFVICEHVGSLATLGETTRWFYSEYLPTSGYEERFAHHYEMYDNRFNPESDDSVVSICIPIN